MEVDRRFSGNTRYKDVGMKYYHNYKKEMNNKKYTTRGIFTPETVEKYNGPER